MIQYELLSFAAVDAVVQTAECAAGKKKTKTDSYF